MIPNTVRNIMVEVRQWAEETQERTGYWNNDMRGLCAISSYILYKKLRKKGYKPTLVQASSHAYVILDDYILDVTATQFTPFEKDKILILHSYSEESKLSCYAWVERKITNLRDAPRAFRKWGMQNPYHPTVRQLMPCDVVKCSS